MQFQTTTCSPTAAALHHRVRSCSSCCVDLLGSLALRGGQLGSRRLHLSVCFPALAQSSRVRLEFCERVRCASLARVINSGVRVGGAR